MTPDLYRLFTMADYNISHEWQGLIIPNLLIGLGFCLVWYRLYRPVIFRCIGMEKPIDYGSFDKVIGFVLSVIIALIIGIATHLIWDGLTHSDFRTFAFEYFLNQQVSVMNYTYPMHRILQIGTSILALPLIVWMTVHYYFKYKQTQDVSRKIRFFAVSLLIIASCFGLYHYLQFSQAMQFNPQANDLYWFIGKAINQFARAWLVIFSLGCIIFLILDHKNCLDD